MSDWSERLSIYIPVFCLILSGCVGGVAAAPAPDDPMSESIGSANDTVDVTVLGNESVGFDDDSIDVSVLSKKHAESDDDVVDINALSKGTDGDDIVSVSLLSNGKVLEVCLFGVGVNRFGIVDCGNDGGNGDDENDDGNDDDDGSGDDGNDDDGSDDDGNSDDGSGDDGSDDGNDGESDDEAGGGDDGNDDDDGGNGDDENDDGNSDEGNDDGNDDDGTGNEGDEDDGGSEADADDDSDDGESSRLAIVDWWTEPTEVYPEETVSAGATVRSYGPAAQRITVELIRDGETVETRRGFVRDTRNFTFEYSFESPGEYRLGIDSAGTKRIQVTPKSTPTPTPTATAEPTATPEPTAEPTPSPTAAPTEEESGLDGERLILMALAVSGAMAIGGLRIWRNGVKP